MLNKRVKINRPVGFSCCVYLIRRNQSRRVRNFVEGKADEKGDDFGQDVGLAF